MNHSPVQTEQNYPDKWQKTALIPQFCSLTLVFFSFIVTATLARGPVTDRQTQDYSAKKGGGDTIQS